MMPQRPITDVFTRVSGHQPGIDDGSWLAEVPALPEVVCYGADRAEAVPTVQALALRVIVERLEHASPLGLLERHVQHSVSN